MVLGWLGDQFNNAGKVIQENWAAMGENQAREEKERLATIEEDSKAVRLAKEKEIAAAPKVDLIADVILGAKEMSGINKGERQEQQIAELTNKLESVTKKSSKSTVVASIEKPDDKVASAGKKEKASPSQYNEAVWKQSIEDIPEIASVGGIASGYAGKPVEEVQLALGLKGQEVDGKFGSDTQKAVEDFQAKNGLRVDGIVGFETATKLGIQTLPDKPNKSFMKDAKGI